MLSPDQNKRLAVEGGMDLALQLLSRPTTAMPARCGDGEVHPGQVNSMPERGVQSTPPTQALYALSQSPPFILLRSVELLGLLDPRSDCALPRRGIGDI